jgi:hypothetical protein
MSTFAEVSGELLHAFANELSSWRVAGLARASRRQPRHGAAAGMAKLCDAAAACVVACGECGGGAASSSLVRIVTE